MIEIKDELYRYRAVVVVGEERRSAVAYYEYDRETAYRNLSRWAKHQEESMEHKSFQQGWNDYVDGKEWPYSFSSTIDYRDGWHDAREYEQEHGKKPEHI